MLSDRHAFNQPKAKKDEIPKGMEKDQAFNRPSIVDVAVIGAGAYAAGEIVSGLQVAFDPTLARNYDGHIVRLINITDLDNQQKSFELLMFSEMPTDFADKDNFLDIALAEDLRKRRRTLSVANTLYKTANSMAYLDLLDVNADLDTRQGAKGPFYFILYPTEAYTATNGLIISFTSWVG